MEAFEGGGFEEIFALQNAFLPAESNVDAPEDYAITDRQEHYNAASPDKLTSPFLSPVDGVSGDSRLIEGNVFTQLHATTSKHPQMKSTFSPNLSDSHSIAKHPPPTSPHLVSGPEHSRQAHVAGSDNCTLSPDSKPVPMPIQNPNLLPSEPLTSPFVDESYSREQMPLGLEKNFASSYRSSAVEENGAKSTINQSSWKPNIQGYRQEARSPYGCRIGGDGFRNFQVSTTCNDNSYRTLGVSSAQPHLPRNIATSNSFPSFFNFSSSPRSLTRLQMVDETTFLRHMPLKIVKVPHPKDEGSTTMSLDYRDESWQGRNDERKGWTPYGQYADFPGCMKMLQDMREYPEDCMPDTATIFNSLEQVNDWRETERQKACDNSSAQDPTEIPKTYMEKAAIVKLLFKAFKSTIAGRSNPNVQRPFEQQIHSNAHVEAVCWELLELAIQRSEGGELSHAYEPEKGTKSASDKGLSFAKRIDSLIQALLFEKSVCINLLKTPKLMDAVDSPDYVGKRTANNRTLNAKKAEISKLGKQKLLELKNTSSAPTKMGAASKRSTTNCKRTRPKLDDDGSDLSDTSPPKKHSPERSVQSAPALSLGYQDQVSPSSALQSRTGASQAFLVAPMSTESIRRTMMPFNLEGMSQPSFGDRTSRSPHIIQSTLLQTIDLAENGAQFLLDDYFDELSSSVNDSDVGDERRS